MSFNTSEVDQKIDFIDLPEIQLSGLSRKMSFSKDETALLWKDFMISKSNLSIPFELYDVGIYSENFFRNFDPNLKFEKWAALETKNLHEKPSVFQELLIPAGLYLRYRYKGHPKLVAKTYQFLLGQYLPTSKFNLDNRPHFALMGNSYKNDSSESEEDLYLPVTYK